MKKKPEHISVIIQGMLQDIVKRPSTPICNMTDLTPKNGKQKKIRLKRGLDYDIDENGNVWMNPNVKSIGLSIRDS